MPRNVGNTKEDRTPQVGHRILAKGTHPFMPGFFFGLAFLLEYLTVVRVDLLHVPPVERCCL